MSYHSPFAHLFTGSGVITTLTGLIATATLADQAVVIAGRCLYLGKRNPIQTIRTQSSILPLSFVGHGNRYLRIDRPGTSATQKQFIRKIERDERGRGR
jgi:hypothetical protein